MIHPTSEHGPNFFQNERGLAVVHYMRWPKVGGLHIYFRRLLDDLSGVQVSSLYVRYLVSTNANNSEDSELHARGSTPDPLASQPTVTYNVFSVNYLLVPTNY